ncbi:MFS transporter [Fodinicola feengrottensis]|uniref:MFS transporter n=1 Tax=Fodinicola feengrottensis TaxID=435914 RepID=A0ABN2FQ13_9ACTN
MKRYGVWIGAVAILAGVSLHVPDYVMAAPDHFMMAGMAMGTPMTFGMALIIGGLALAGWSLLATGKAKRALAAKARRTTPGAADQFAAIDGARLSRAHVVLALVLTVGLVVDTMKPATLGFVVPGVRHEYGLTTAQAAALPFIALTGTVIGSLLWGYVADLVGRRSTIVFSALLYIGTSICGFMPSFGWNLVMCFIMGMSAGGMLPTVYALMSESVPSRYRGWLLVLQSGFGATLGYLVASGAAAVLAPLLSWRFLWVLGAPTGLLLLILCRWIPESPRFLLSIGQPAEAEQVMRTYGIELVSAIPGDKTEPLPAARPARRSFIGKVGGLLVPEYRWRTIAVLLYGLGWGLVNWGFVTFLPTFLSGAGMSSSAPAILFTASLLTVPATGLAALLYARWSSRRAIISYAVGTVLVLSLFVFLRPENWDSAGPLVALLTVLLIGAGGMIAMLSPYAAEIYPTALRGTGSGLVAAAGKAGGLGGPLLVASAPSLSTLAVAGAIPVALAALAIWRTGIETAAQPLVETPEIVPATD